MISGEFLRLFDDVCELTVLRNGESVPLISWEKPTPHEDSVGTGYSANGFSQMVSCLRSVDGKFSHGLPATNLWHHLVGQEVEVVATKADGQQVRFRASIDRANITTEDCAVWCEYRSNGVVTVDEADTPILVGV